MLDFRFGSKADIALVKSDVRFTTESGHWLSALGCPLCAKSGHYAVQLDRDVSRHVLSNFRQ
jgi:hypothetical protein